MRNAKKRNLSKRWKPQFAHYVPPVTRSQTAAQKKKGLKVSGLFNVTDIDKATYLFRSVSGGRHLKRTILVRSPKLVPHLENKRGPYALPLTRTFTGTLPSNRLFTASRKKDAQKTRNSRNKFKFSEVNKWRQKNFRSRSPPLFQTNKGPKGFRRIWLRSHGPSRLSENEPRRFTRICLRQKKSLESPEVHHPCSGKMKMRKDEEQVENFNGDNYLHPGITNATPTDIMKPQLAANLTGKPFAEVNSHQTSDFCKNSIDPSKRLNFPKSYEFRVSLTPEGNAVSVGIQTQDLIVKDIEQQDTKHGYKSIISDILDEKGENPRETGSFFGGMHQGDTVAVNTQNTENLKNQTDFGTKMSGTGTQVGASHGATNGDQQGMTPNPGIGASPMLRFTFSENKSTTGCSEKPYLRQTAPCQQESNPISAPNEDSHANAGSLSSFDASNGSGEGNDMAALHDDINKQQEAKDKKHSSNSCNIILDFFLMLALPIL